MNEVNVRAYDNHRIPRCFVILIAIIIVSLIFSSCSLIKSDEQLINERIDSFLVSYNSGDMDGILECLDAKTRNTYKAAMDIGNVFIGNTGFNISISDLFSISVGIVSNGDILTISDREIVINSDQSAIVTVTLSYQDKIDEFSEDAYFTMVKENGDWYIENLENK